ncbi:MAG: helix-turn-helix transcriptional regulator [Thermoplasmata archaeon]|nr:helix-turn-helix transcriptional regulator [Thermoplasmata archaeon]
MSFELSVVTNTPLSSIDELDEACEIFLSHIGYLPKGYESRTGAANVRDSVPFRLFVNCLLKRRDKVWLIEELAAELETSKPTVYRHINKLKSMDLLDFTQIEVSNNMYKKGYRLRYDNLAKAWNFVEAHVGVAMENYRKTVDHIQKLVEAERRK